MTAASATDLWVSWEDYHHDIENLALAIRASGWQFDVILCLARGGLRPGDILSRLFKVPLAILSTRSYEGEAGNIRGTLGIAQHVSHTQGELRGKILLVDDLVDSGATLQTVHAHLPQVFPDITEVRSAVIWYKHCSVITPDYYVHRLKHSPWIHQPFECYEEMGWAQIKEQVANRQKQPPAVNGRAMIAVIEGQEGTGKLSYEGDCARSLRAAAAVAERRCLLDEPHMAPLTAFVKKLRLTHPEWEFPDFDPMDGGVEAEMLFLFEKPGPKTSSLNQGSGFISRNNNDPSAQATFSFMREAGLQRKQTILWNVIPGWNGTRKVTTEEIRSGMEDLLALLALLPKLKVIVLVGNNAKRADKYLKELGLPIITSAHPSPIVRASKPGAWRAIPERWREAAQLLKSQ